MGTVRDGYDLGPGGLYKQSDGSGPYVIDASGVATLTNKATDGASASIGATADAAATTDIGTFSLIALFKRLLEKITAGLAPAEGIALASAARTTDQSVDIVNNLPNAHLHVVINVTENGGIFSLTPKIRAIDPAVPGGYYDLLIGAAITANGRTVLKVGPSIAVAANVSAQDMVPKNINIQIDALDATSVTYSVGYVLI